MLNTEFRSIYDEEHGLFRDQVRKFIDKEVLPHLDRWEQEEIVDRNFWEKCGEAGLICPTVPENDGGLGLDFKYNAIIDEEMAYARAINGLSLQSDITIDYIVEYGSKEQKEAIIPKAISGELILAIAMTEPDTGSDLQGIKTTAVRDGNEYVLNGSKTYITNGQNADIVILVAKTKSEGGSRGTSLILVEADREGFARGRNLDKIGQHAADTSELSFNDVRVPITNCLGEEHKGFGYLMTQLPQERLSIAVTSQAGAQRAFDEAVNFTKDRKAFGKTVFDFQNTQFILADLAAKLQVGWAHLDWAIERHVQGKLTTAEASAAKLYHTELECEIADKSLQLHGGAGYMNEYPIARIWRDSRVSRIFGGTSEIMKIVIARSL